MSYLQHPAYREDLERALTALARVMYWQDRDEQSSVLRGLETMGFDAWSVDDPHVEEDFDVREHVSVGEPVTVIADPRGTKERFRFDYYAVYVSGSLSAPKFAVRALKRKT